MTSFAQSAYLVLLEPALIRLGVVQPGSGDPTYGRTKIPYTARERKWIYDNPRVQVTERRVSSGLIERATGKAAQQEQPAAKKGGSDLGGDTWYNVWSIPEEVEKANLKSDVVIVHGMNDYGGKLGPLAMPYLEAGFRVIVYDLPGHGRSVGVHGYAPDMRALPQALHAVMRDVMKHDGEAARGRKMFLTGTSMGGFACLYYAALYSPIPKNKTKANGTNGHANGNGNGAEHPPAEGGAEADEDTIPGDTDDLLRPNLAGIAVTAPMITISPESTPPWVLFQLARFLRVVTPRLPLVKGVKGNTSDDPRVDVEFHKDPLTYKGNVRIATGLAIWEGIEHLQTLPSQITCPVALHHGSKDRATDAQGTKDFFPRLGSEKKTLRIWEGYEHIMQKYVEDMTEEDTAKLHSVIHALRDFFLELARES
ncbi:hypothetical protein A4X13_0g5779 [Tilletia indica]|uniref:Serine aminopeptidase S33 domain-containing protein n=1 Tax=Tilletia indica TaxID=43049 RepID=A0A8T8SSM8_9BASI|nr:hypothetical protein A4X13_0g5779 [Tilletia indica]